MSATQKILNLLSDQKWHCGQEITNLYIKDDRRRITDLKKIGYVIESQRCNLPGHIHPSGLFMRRLVGTPQDYVRPESSFSKTVSKISQNEIDKTLVKSLTKKPWWETEKESRPVKQLSQQTGGLW